MRRTPLEPWIAAKISRSQSSELFRQHLREYQLARIRETVTYVSQKSPFYRNRLRGFSALDLNCLEDIAALPFTTPSDLAENNPSFLCVSQSDIDRVITLPAPGGTRRSFFTADDLELTTDFFHHGMSTLVRPSQKVLILMPGDRPGSVGDLLQKALARMDAEGIVHGLVDDPEQVAGEILKHEIDALVGIPTQVLAVARSEAGREIPKSRIKGVLLSADYVPAAVVQELRRLWDCPTFNHYGTTEMGLGGGVECEALSEYHLREADLYFEIVDPDSGQPQPAGTAGEVVFTTLTRQGMPLVRYRTGDLARFVTEPCPCGSVLPRMGTVRGSIRDMVRLCSGDWLGIADLDEVLFSFPQILDYEATITRNADSDCLDIALYADVKHGVPDSDRVITALRAVPQLDQAITLGRLSVDMLPVKETTPVRTSATKRTLILREVREA